MRDGIAQCLHNACIRRTIGQHSFYDVRIRTRWAVLKNRQLAEDAAQYIAMRILESQAKGEPVFINGQWIWYALANFVKHRWQVPRGVMVCAQPTDGDGDEEQWKDPMHAHFRAIDPAGDPFRIVLYRQVEVQARTLGQEPTLLLLRGDVTKTDAWILERSRTITTLLPDDARAHHEFIRQWLATWAEPDAAQA